MRSCLKRVLKKTCNTIVLKSRNIKPETPVFSFFKTFPVIRGSDSGDRELNCSLFELGYAGIAAEKGKRG